MRKLFPAWIFMTLGLVSFNVSHAKDEAPLYPGPIPNAIDAPDNETLRDPKEPFTFLLNTSRPTVTIYLPSAAKLPTPAVVIFPGGSYRGTSILKEGYQVAEAFNQMGVAAFVVKYRTPDDIHMHNRTTAPLQDAQQAIRLVRANASKWHIDPHRVGIVGFSAGGHLAATASLFYESPVLPGPKGETPQDLRPDFSVLVYPVISMTNELTHELSRSNLLGPNFTPEAVARYSMERNVTAQSPPMFLVHAVDDKAVPVGNTLSLFEALIAHGVTAEMHIYPRGGHGFGLVNATTEDRWIDRCRNWLASQGILNKQ
jgi:acetyl esterase/lipase